LIWDFIIFVGDVTSGVSFWPFWLRLLGRGPSYRRELFHSSFYWKV